MIFNNQSIIMLMLIYYKEHNMTEMIQKISHLNKTCYDVRHRYTRILDDYFYFEGNAEDLLKIKTLVIPKFVKNIIDRTRYWYYDKYIGDRIVKVWFKNNKIDRDGGPALIWGNGTQMWFKYGSRHRTDGPAVTLPNGGFQYFQYGKFHRIDGPAIKRANGGYPRWYFDGIELKGMNSQINIVIDEDNYTQYIKGLNKRDKKLIRQKKKISLSKI